MNEDTTTARCDVCHNDLPDTAFPTRRYSYRDGDGYTRTVTGRDYSTCRKCIAAARVAAKATDFIPPKAQSFIADADRFGLQVEVNQDHSNIVSVTVRRSAESCEGDNMLAVANRADSLHVIFTRKTGKFLGGHRFSLFGSSVDLKKVTEARSWMFVMADEAHRGR